MLLGREFPKDAFQPAPGAALDVKRNVSAPQEPAVGDEYIVFGAAPFNLDAVGSSTDCQSLEIIIVNPVRGTRAPFVNALSTMCHGDRQFAGRLMCRKSIAVWPGASVPV